MLVDSACGESSSLVLLYPTIQPLGLQDRVIFLVAEALLSEEVLKLVVICVGYNQGAVMLLSPHLYLCEKL